MMESTFSRKFIVRLVVNGESAGFCVFQQQSDEIDRKEIIKFALGPGRLFVLTDPDLSVSVEKFHQRFATYVTLRGRRLAFDDSDKARVIVQKGKNLFNHSARAALQKEMPPY